MQSIRRSKACLHRWLLPERLWHPWLPPSSAVSLWSPPLPQCYDCSKTKPIFPVKWAWSSFDTFLAMPKLPPRSLQAGLACQTHSSVLLAILPHAVKPTILIMPLPLGCVYTCQQQRADLKLTTVFLKIDEVTYMVWCGVQVETQVA